MSQIHKVFFGLFAAVLFSFAFASPALAAKCGRDDVTCEPAYTDGALRCVKCTATEGGSTQVPKPTHEGKKCAAVGDQQWSDERLKKEAEDRALAKCNPKPKACTTAVLRGSIGSPVTGSPGLTDTNPVTETEGNCGASDAMMRFNGIDYEIKK